MKKVLILLIVFILFPITSIASSNTQASVGDKYFDNLNDAINSATSTDTITLLTNVTLEKELNINKEVHIDLNGNNITSDTNVFLVENGALYLTGKGTIKEDNPNYGAIKVFGSINPTNKNYSFIDIDKGVTLIGWSGIFISQKENKSYGVSVNFRGNIKAVSDISGSEGVGIYVNGNIKDKTGEPVINIMDNAHIESNGVGLYLGGYSKTHISDGHIIGAHSGIAIKAGRLKIDSGTIECIGQDTTPTEGYNNGVNASGTAIQIESNSGYAGNIELTINKGNIISKNSNVIYEYIGKGTSTTVKEINLIGGSYKSNAKKEVFLLSNSFKTTHPKFIRGGEYSSNPNEYLLSGYTSTLEDGMYTITKTTMAEVLFKTNTSSKSYTFPIILILLLLSITLIYFNREKPFIKNILKKINL